MLIIPNSNDIKFFHDFLVDIYREEDYPIKIISGYRYEGTIDYIVNHITTVTASNKPRFPHILQKAAVFLYYLNSLHPFMDGNKRTSLIVTYYFLLWNGYYLIIPSDTADFIIQIAKPEAGVKLNDAYKWIIKHSKRTLYGIFRNLLLSSYTTNRRIPLTFQTMFDSYYYLPLPKFIEAAIFKRSPRK